jgi:hypothetical protein
MKHSPDNCPLFNDNIKNRMKEGFNRRADSMNRHKVKIMAAATSVLDHLTFYICESPSQQALENCIIETGHASWNDVEIWQVYLVEDAIKMLDLCQGAFCRL